MSGNVCKFCGAGQQGEDTLGYQCASWRYREIDWWVQSSRCQQRCLQIRVKLEGTVETLRQRIESATQRLESLNGKHVGQAEIYALVEILEGKV